MADDLDIEKVAKRPAGSPHSTPAAARGLYDFLRLP